MAKYPTQAALWGVWVDQELDDCLKLLALLRRAGKGAVLRKIVRQYIKDNDAQVIQLIERYALLVYYDWDLCCRETTPFVEYLEEIEKTLRRKKFREPLIKSIIEECKLQEEVRSANR